MKPWRPRALLRRLGVDVVRYPLHGTLYGHLRWLLGAHDVATVLDVGANQGQFASGLRTEARYSGGIVSFEPAPEAFQHLAASAAQDPRWTAVQVALGSDDDQLELLTFDKSDWNSLHKPAFDRIEAAGRTPITPTGSVPCQVRRLEGLWDDLIPPGERVFLKSDTQGHELAVLEGSGDKLGNLCGLLLEVSIEPYYEDEPDLGEVLEATASYGFSPSGFYPVTRRKGSLAIDTVDVCFVRDDRRGVADD